MRTNIDVDDQLLGQAMRDSGAKAKKRAVEEGLKMLVKVKAQGSIRELRGKVKCDGNLERSRLGRGAE